MKERGGPIYAKVIPDAKTVTLRGAVLMTVQPQTTVSTDEHAGYNLLERDGYRRGRRAILRRNGRGLTKMA